MSDYRLSTFDMIKILLILSTFFVSILSAKMMSFSTVQVFNDKPVIDGVIGASEYPFKNTVIGVDIYWFNDDVDLYMGLKSPGLGWVAVAFDPIDGHIGANFIFGAVVESETIVSDQYSIEQYWHTPDIELGGTDDILEYAGLENERTTFEFHIRLDSADIYDKSLVPGEDVKILIAYNLLDDNFMVKHSERAITNIKLYKLQKPIQQAP